MKVKILDIGMPLGGFYIYNLSVCASMVKQVKDKIRTQGTFMGELGSSSSMTIDMAQVSHEVTDLYIEDGKVYADVRVLGTPMGGLLHDMLDKESNIVFAPRGLGKASTDGVISDYELVSIDVMLGK